MFAMNQKYITTAKINSSLFILSQSILHYCISQIFLNLIKVPLNRKTEMSDAKLWAAS